MKTGLSKASRRQLLVSDMVVGVIDSLRHVLKVKPQRTPLHVWLADLDGLVARAKQIASPAQWSDQAYMQYRRALISLQAELTGQYGEIIDPRDYTALVLAVVEDVRAQLPAGGERGIVWFNMARILGWVLGQMPVDEAVVDQGVERAEAFKEAMGW